MTGLGLCPAAVFLLREVHLMTAGTSPASALAGTIMGVLVGSFALAHAETVTTWQARRRARKAAQDAATAEETAVRLGSPQTRPPRSQRSGADRDPRPCSGASYLGPPRLQLAPGRPAPGPGGRR